MLPAVFFKSIVDPGLAFTSQVAGVPSDDRARVLVMAIAGQETRWKERRQIYSYSPGKYQTVGARGYWQYERLGGVDQLFMIMSHLRNISDALDIPYNTFDIYEAIAWNDLLACAMARLLLWQDPAPLPAVDDEQGGWAYYNRIWRPGAPHPDTWHDVHSTARRMIEGSTL